MLSRTIRPLAQALPFVLLISCWGCARQGSGATPNLIPVTGKVTFRGKPVTKGIVRFDSEGYGRPAKGQLQSDGSYALKSGDADGVLAGAHRVSIGGFDKPLASDRSLKKYGSPNSSQLEVEVDKDHTEHNFELK